MPRNLNGYTLTVNFEATVTDQLNIDNFCNGTVRIAFNGHTLKGNIRAIGRSLEILIYGNKPGSTKGSTRGKIVPGKNGYLYKLGDLSSLKEAILKMEKNRVLLNPETCFEKSKYSVQNHIEKLVAFYTDSI